MQPAWSRRYGTTNFPDGDMSADPVAGIDGVGLERVVRYAIRVKKNPANKLRVVFLQSQGACGEWWHASAGHLNDGAGLAVVADPIRNSRVIGYDDRMSGRLTAKPLHRRSRCQCARYLVKFLGEA